jgi:hypothetical protein
MVQAQITRVTPPRHYRAHQEFAVYGVKRRDGSFATSVADLR